MMTVSKWAVAMALVAGCGVEQSGQAQQAITSDAGAGSGGGGGGSGGGTVWHSSNNGGAAYASFYDGQSSGSLQASEYGNGANRTVNLSFNYQGPDPASEVCFTYSDPWWGTYTYCYYSYIVEWGWGTIPSADLRIDANARTARLHTTTDSTFSIQRCTFGYYPWLWNCTNGVSETLDLMWNANGVNGFSHSGTSEMRMGGYAMRTSGKYTSNSADITGTAFGRPASTMWYGTIIDTHGTNVSRDIVVAGP